MTDTKQPVALSLACELDLLVGLQDARYPNFGIIVAESAAELRRLHGYTFGLEADRDSAVRRMAEEKMRAHQVQDDSVWVDRFFVCRHPVWPDPLQCSSVADAVRAARSPAVSDTSRVFIVRERVARTEFHGADIEAVADQPSLECLQQSAELPDCRGRVMVDEDGECGISWRGGMPPENGTNIYTEQQVRALQAAPPAPASVAAPSNRIAEALRAFDTAMEACSDYPDTSGDIDGLVKAVRKARAALAAAPAQAVAVPWDNFPAYLIDHCEGDTITEEGLQRALAAMLADPQYAAPAQEHATQLAGEPVAYLDLGAGGYLDIGADLSDEQLSKLPKGRHMLVIGGTHGVDGYAAAPGEMQKESDAAQLLKKYRKLCLEIGRGDSYHIARIDAAIAAARAQAHKDERA